MSLFTGRKLKQYAVENKKVTHTQTADPAVNAIIQKLGSISDDTHYYHRGNGIWSKYLISEDRKKTGKITAKKYGIKSLQKLKIRNGAYLSFIVQNCQCLLSYVGAYPS